MIPKLLSEITASDIDTLLNEQTPEGRTLEYERDLPTNSNDDKREFLADVSSLANSAGGDLIFGIDEKDGVPAAITGVPPSGLDAELLRLKSIIRSGLDPRISVGSQVVDSSNAKKVIVMRVDQSWNAPHRIVHNDRFYARSSNGKYPLDTGELRQAFMRSADTVKSISDFRA